MNRSGDSESSGENDTFWRALLRPFRPRDKNLSPANRIAFSYATGQDERVASSSPLNGCDLDALPRMSKE